MTATDDRWVQWGVFHSDSAARRAVRDLKPGRVRYEKAGTGLIAVLVPRPGHMHLEGQHYELCVDPDCTEGP